jgi:signal transduction histidine kinase
MTAPSAAPRLEAVDVLVDLLSEIDSPDAEGDFYDRVCEAVCRMTSMERAVLFRYHEARAGVRAAGSRGINRELLSRVFGSLEDAPLAHRALATNQVVVTSEDIEDGIPERYARLFAVTTLTCIPIAAAGRWFGVIVADRGGGRFDLSDEERDALWLLGRMVALAASARIATRQQERARELTDRITLTRDVHERVVQRLFGVSLALAPDREPRAEVWTRCSSEIQAALTDLRAALRRPLVPEPEDLATTLREELRRLGEHHRDLGVRVTWPDDVHVPEDCEPLAQSVLAEALRNADKHADPTHVDVLVGCEDGAFTLEVSNDGVRGDQRGTGMGLRLAFFEAVQRGGLLEYGSKDEDRWRVRLVMPPVTE